MILIAFAPEALRRRETAIELEHTLLTEANRLDERVLGGPVPRIPLVESELAKPAKRTLRRRRSLAWIVAGDCWTIVTTVLKWLLTAGVGWSHKAGTRRAAQR